MRGFQPGVLNQRADWVSKEAGQVIAGGSLWESWRLDRVGSRRWSVGKQRFLPGSESNMGAVAGHKFTLGCWVFFSLVLTNRGCPNCIL